jgi:hypothetical protein
MIVLFAYALCAASATTQLLPPPKDGEIRVVHWELRAESQVWLTLEPRSSKGAAAPMLTFAHTFPGKPPGPSASQIEIRAFGWAPHAELSFVLDDRETIDLSPPGGVLTSGVPSDYVSATVSVDVLRKLARATKITGRALGVDFELAPSQRKALATFAKRVSGAGL